MGDNREYRGRKVKDLYVHYMMTYSNNNNNNKTNNINSKYKVIMEISKLNLIILVKELKN
jgi:hypothetical protein